MTQAIKFSLANDLLIALTKYDKTLRQYCRCIKEMYAGKT